MAWLSNIKATDNVVLLSNSDAHLVSLTKAARTVSVAGDVVGDELVSFILKAELSNVELCKDRELLPLNPDFVIVQQTLAGWELDYLNRTTNRPHIYFVKLDSSLDYVQTAYHFGYYPMVTYKEDKSVDFIFWQRNTTCAAPLELNKFIPLREEAKESMLALFMTQRYYQLYNAYWSHYKDFARSELNMFCQAALVLKQLSTSEIVGYYIDKKWPLAKSLTPWLLQPLPVDSNEWIYHSPIRKIVGAVANDFCVIISTELSANGPQEHFIITLPSTVINPIRFDMKGVQKIIAYDHFVITKEDVFANGTAADGSGDRFRLIFDRTNVVATVESKSKSGSPFILKLDGGRLTVEDKKDYYYFEFDGPEGTARSIPWHHDGKLVSIGLDTKTEQLLLLTLHKKDKAVKLTRFALASLRQSLYAGLELEH